jgi:hypothetical protein
VPASICGFVVIEGRAGWFAQASWPRLKRSPFTFAVIRADQAVTVTVSLHFRDELACLVVYSNNAAVLVRIQLNQLFAVGLIGRDRATPKRRGQADAQAA